MRGNRRCSLGILFATTFALAAHAEEPDHLVPRAEPGFARPFWSELDPSFDLRDQHAWGGVVINEASVLWLRTTSTGPKVEFRTATARTGPARELLQRGDASEVTVHSDRAAVSIGTYRALQDAWEAMLQRVREPEDEYAGRCGGVTDTSYWFFGASEDPDKRISGSTQSPLCGRLPARLVGLAYNLAGHAMASPQSRPTLDANLRAAAEQLARDANAHN